MRVAQLHTKSWALPAYIAYRCHCFCASPAYFLGLFSGLIFWDLQILLIPNDDPLGYQRPRNPLLWWRR